ncbi:MAG TPA: leucine--tRNA ligase [Acidimicrobiia bacterium]|jgi:leucyl-tRNA synthetase
MTPADTGAANDIPKHRYDARLANAIEQHWQDRWETERTFWAPNPHGLLADVNAERAALSKLYVLDMFPYPSGAGLHVGHPLGFIGTDVFARYQRMLGRNVLHAMGMDAFGLPAEQYAVQTGQHPRVTTAENIATYRDQLRSLGLAHDPRRGVSTADPSYYHWTQWIFLQIFESWYDADADRARPITELTAELDAGTRQPDDDGAAWSARDAAARRDYVDRHRLAYIDEAPVNWCPGLGTVLANEEVNAEGRSERGNFPVFKRPLKQWMLRITSYADRLIADLDRLDWPEPIKLMQRNWIGRSVGALVDFDVDGTDLSIRVFTTRPDTLFGATYMVLAPEHELVDKITPNEWPRCPQEWRGLFGAERSPRQAVAAYREFAAAKSELERTAEGRVKTGVFTGAYAVNPATGEYIPVFIADYVLMGYGTGAIMAVPAEDERDWEFAEEFSLPIVRTKQPPADFDGKAFTGDGPSINSANDEVSLDGLDVAASKRKMTDWLESSERGEPTVTYKLRDWLFSRQRYWGEPFPIVYDAYGPRAVPESMLPIELPDLFDFAPTVSDDPDALPAPPLARAENWVRVTLDLGDGPKEYTREVNTMPQWAGSCWYYLRYLDPTNEDAFVDPAVERYWAGATHGGAPTGMVDLYVGGVEHAVLHLLYARFWHKVLFDLGHVSTAEPFGRLFNQGYIQAYAYTDDRGFYVEAKDVVERDGGYFLDDAPVAREYGKIGKSLKNVVTPDEMIDNYGADTFRMYEMFMGPLDASRPWQTRDVVGVYRFLQRLWRVCIDEDTGEPHVDDQALDVDTARVLHRTIAAVRGDVDALGFNTVIARLFELNNHVWGIVESRGRAPRAAVEPLLLMLAPLAPHISEELWSRIGHSGSLAYEPFPVHDPALLVETTAEIPVQVNGKVRARITVAADADAAACEAAARADERIAELLAGKAVRKVVAIPGRLVNFVV